jgi:hypothetical protein
MCILNNQRMSELRDKTAQFYTYDSQGRSTHIGFRTDSQLDYSETLGTTYFE